MGEFDKTLHSAEQAGLRNPRNVPPRPVPTNGETALPTPRHEAEAEAESLLVTMDQVTAAEPVYLAGGTVRESGVHLWWGPPNFYKTYSCIWLALEMTQLDEGDQLFGVPGMEIRRPWKRVLWLGDEESAEEWKWRAENLARGHGLQPPGAELIFADASGGPVLLTTDHIGLLLDEAEKDGNVDAVFLDPLPNLLPQATSTDGDPNPSALARVCRPLRRLAKTRRVGIFMLTHPNASGLRERGATAYRGSADVVVEVKFDSGLLTLLDVKNRDRERGQMSFRPEWSRDSAGNMVLKFSHTDTPTESLVKNMSPTAKMMFSAAQAGAGRIRQADLMEAKYPYKNKADVSKRTKFRALSDLFNAKLICTDNGIVRLLDDDSGADDD